MIEARKLPGKEGHHIRGDSSATSEHLHDDEHPSARPGAWGAASIGAEAIWRGALRLQWLLLLLRRWSGNRPEGGIGEALTGTYCAIEQRA